MGDRITHRLAAILAADAVGFSRLMGADEEATLHELDANRALFRAHTEEHGGRIVDMAGDSVLAVFGTAAGAVRAAVAVQAAVERRNADVAEDRRLRYRVGVNLGDIIEKADGSIYGDGVNVAARLQSLAEPGGILLSSKVHDEVEGRLGVETAAAGEHRAKNIARPLRTYRVLAAGARATERETEVQPQAPQASVASAPAPPPLPDRPSIVVLPFANMSGDKEQEYFADGITEDIITDLSKVSGMFVIARNSSFTYKGKAVNVTEAGHELGVRNVLEGSVRKAGNRVRITAQLIDAASGGHLWAERYDRNLDDIFAVQDEVTREIVKALRVTLTKHEQVRLAARATESVEAWDLFVRGRELYWRHQLEANAEARQRLAAAVALDGGFADAIALLGATYVVDFINRWGERPDEALDVAFAHARRALELGGARAYPHLAMAAVRLWRREHDEALAEAKRCVEIDPNLANGWWMYGHVLHFIGRSAEAIEPITRAIRLDPLTSDLYLHFLGQSHFALGDDEEAVRVLRQRIERDPNTDVSRVLLASALGHLGHHEEARSVWMRAREINPRYSLRQKRAILPFRDAAVLDRMAEGLAMAGIDPEEGGA